MIVARQSRLFSLVTAEVLYLMAVDTEYRLDAMVDAVSHLVSGLDRRRQKNGRGTGDLRTARQGCSPRAFT